MNKPWKVILVFVGMFLAGAIFGGPLLGWYRDYRQERRPPFAERTMERYQRELKITAAQEERIRPILLRMQAEWRRLRQENVRNLSAVVDQMHREVAAELTPEQQVRLEEMRKELRLRTERLRGRVREREAEANKAGA